MMRIEIHKFYFRPLIVTVLLLILVCPDEKAQTAYSADSLYMELTKVSTPTDSILILHNLYDCVLPSQRKDVLYQIFETAERAKDYNTMLETVFLMAALYQEMPEMEEKLLEMTQRVPDSELQRLHMLYIKTRFQTANLYRISETERQQMLHQALKNYREHNRLDKYDRMGCLFLICTNLRSTTNSDLLVYYLQQLQEMVEDSPYEDLAVRTQFYTMAINAYIDHGLYDKAIEANKRILDIVAQFDRLHESQGRVFRSYDGSLYQAYHNMLVCASELTDEEIDMYYEKAVYHINKNLALRKNPSLKKRTDIFYLMAKKSYAEALPLLKEQLNSETTKRLYYQLAYLLVKAASETGDKDALLQGSKILNTLYRERLTAKSDLRLSELQTLYDIENLKTQNRGLTFENQRMEISRRHQEMVAVLVAAVILIGILIWMVSLYIRSHRIAKRLSVANKKLIEERNALKDVYARLLEVRNDAEIADRAKSNFVHNLSGEIRVPLGAIVENSHLIAQYAYEDKRPYIRDYAKAMSENSDVLIRLVNDVLDLPMIESGKLRVQPVTLSVDEICKIALDYLDKHVGPNVRVLFPNSSPSGINVVTDPHIFEEVLVHVISNAVKFTPSGSITFEYKINQQRNEISFIVTDTGIGIPRGMENKIFERFVKIDPTIQGAGLGLYVGRLLTKMLGGTLSLDQSYRDGAKFIFTIPIR